MNKGDTPRSFKRSSRAKKKFLASFVLFSFTFASPLSLFAQVADAPADSAAASSVPLSVGGTTDVVAPSAELDSQSAQLQAFPAIQAPIPVKEDIIAGPSEKEWSLLGLPRFPEIRPVLNTPANEAAVSPGIKISTEGEALVDSGSSGGTSALTSVAANKWLNSYSDAIRLPEPEHVSGAFTQDIPIGTPPGRNGVEPNLKLSYNSQNRDDENLFGLGWSLNIPVIERMNKSGVEDLYNQQYFVSSFDGELATTSSSTYGAKFDYGSFRNYSFATSTSIWTMTDKAGVKYTFGTSATSRLSNPNDSSQVYRWMLEEMRDTNGNFMKYEYTKDSGQIYPSKITYTGSGVAGGPFEVSFLAESRSDNPVSYKYGFQVKTLYRVKEIDIKFNGNLVKKYVLSFTTGHNGVRSLLQTVTETGYDETGTPITLSPMTFTYQASNTSWSQTADSPWNLPDITDVNWKDTGFRVLNYTNNSQSDLLLLKESLSPSGYEYQNPWSSIPISQTAPALVDSSGNDIGSALVDVNGDGHTDIILGKEPVLGNPGGTVYLRSGTGFASTTYSNTPYLVDTDGNDKGIRFGDFNGDGYPDYLRGKAGLSYYLFLNKADGTGWANGVSVSGSPEIFVDVSGNDYGARVMDVNGDGLDDILRRTEGNNFTIINFNLGGGTNWSISDIPNTSQYAGPQITGASGKDIGTRMTDINSDGLIDFVVSTPTRGIHFYINRGTGAGSDPWGWADLSIGTDTIPYFLDTSDRDIGVRMIQANYDDIPDFVRGGYNTTKNNYLSSGDPVDVLTSVTLPTGGNISATYKGVDAETSLLRVVKTIARDPGLGGTTVTTTYSFTGGQFQADWQNRKFRGFDQVDEIDSLNNYMITNYHQGNGDNINSPYPWYSYAQGEYDDTEAKMYRPWRVQKITPEVGTSNTAINRWEKKDLGGGRTLVYLKDAIQYDYDLNSSHKDSAASFDYATSTGNLISTIHWGEVSGNTSDGTWGTWSDTGSDKRTTALSYATGGPYGVTGALSQSTLADQSGTKINETKNYYDNLSHASVDKGNLTKQEFWKTGSSYASTTKTYDGTYGLVTQEKDAKGNATNYTYDSYNLFVATSTNALSQTRGFQYDYSSGKAKSVIDENNRVYQTVYDGLDRVKEEKQPDQTNPSTLVTKSLYTYTDTPLAVSVQSTNYLNAAISTNSYEYKDGLGRTLQTRAQAEGSDYAVRDFAYNNRGLLEKESLPYFSSGSSRTTATSVSALFTNYTYDALSRVTQASNAVGNTTNAYDDWKVTTTDANGKTKDLTKDAYGNLVTIVEHNGGSNYTTSYTYDGASNLTSITDASSNVRNFAYDGMGRRLTAQDLHSTADGTYGTWTYSYDDAGNMTQSVDPKNQTINWVYDGLNRPLTEDYTGGSGTEVTYTYDSCADGKTRLCTASSAGAFVSSLYNPLGLLKEATTTIAGIKYATQYDYDRQGNKTLITYPDGAQVKYTYNAANLLDKVEGKENGGSFANIVSSFDYSPTLQPTLAQYGNGALTQNTYDASNLYRLSTKLTTVTSTGGSAGTISLDGTVATSTSTGNINKTITVGSNNNRLLLVTFATHQGGGDATAMTYGGVSLSKIKSQVGSYGETVSIWTLVAPATGSNTLSVSAPGNDFNAIGVYSLYGVKQSNPSVTAGASGGNSTASLSITPSSANNWIIDVVEAEPVPTVNGAQTKDWQVQGGSNYMNGAGSHVVQTTAQAQTMQWSLSYGGRWNQAAVAIEPVTLSGGGTTLNVQNLAYTYDALGNITQIVDTSDTKTAKTIAFTYDDLSRLLTASTTNATTSPNFLQTFTYDPLGNITSGPLGTYSYTGNTGSNYANPHAVTAIATSTPGQGGSGTISLDGTVATSTSTGNITKVITVGSNSDRFLLVAFSTHQGGGDATAMTYNSVSLTKLKSQVGSYGETTSLWGLVAPATGSYALQVNAPGNDFNTIGVYSLYGVKQQNPTTTAGASGGNSTASLSITSPSNNNWIIDSVESEPVPTVSGAQTKDWQTQGASNYMNGGGSHVVKATAGVQTMQWGLSYGGRWNQAAIAVEPSSTGSGTTTATTTLTYDANGNLTGDGIFTYAWDYRNRLTQSGNGTATSTYAYDHEGNRVKLVEGATTTIFPNTLYSTTTGATGTTTKHVFGNGSMLATIEKAGSGIPTTRYIHTDHLGGSNVVTDSAGNVVQTLDYYPFGDERINNQYGGADETRKFVGMERDDSTGLDYAKARYYDNTRGQFISQDPVFWEIGQSAEGRAILSDPQLQNSYSWARNNPITNKDPEGNFAIGPAIMMAIRIYGAFQLGFSGGEVLNSEYLFRNSYSDSQRGDARFNLGFNALTSVAGTQAKTPFEQIILGLGPDALNGLDKLRGAGTQVNVQGSGSQNYVNPIYNFTSNYPGLGPSLYQIFSAQLNSSSIQQRYQATQTYNTATGATSNESKLWTTPGGAVITWTGQVVSPAPSSSGGN